MKMLSRKSDLHSFVVISLVLFSCIVIGVVLKQNIDVPVPRTLPPVNTSEAVDLPSFPGAQGFGTTTKGGRGGRVVYVTNLNDSGAGSLRDALSLNEPRIVVFKVGGVIKINSDLRISSPYITIAGQTAPGDGIVIRGGPLRVATNNVIVRGLRFRVGDDPGGVSTGTRDGIVVSSTGTQAGTEVYNIVIDHCSVAWGLDENISTWNARVHDVTFSYNISAQALYDSIHVDEGQPAGVFDNHSMGFMVGDQSKRISIHHNLLAHNHSRPPAVFGDTSAQIVNNVIYNWGGGSWPVQINNSNSSSLPTVVDVIGNYIKRGVNTTTTSRVAVRIDNDLAAGSKVYVKDNKFYDVSNKLIGTDIVSDNAAGALRYKSNTVSLSPALAVDDLVTAYDAVLSQAGASAPKRDAVDTFVVDSVKNGTGTIVDCVTSCNEATDRRNPQNGYPTYASGAAPDDTDKDGMPDAWEIAHRLNPQLASDGNALAPNGYTWVEEYLNSFYIANDAVPLPTTNVITSLDVKDADNSVDWSIRDSPVNGDKAYGDRIYTFAALPSLIANTEWIRTPADSKLFVASPLVTFSVTKPVTVYVAHDDRITAKPEWLASWTNTGEKIVLPNAPTFNVNYTLYSKQYPVGSISLGANGHTSHLMYMIFVK